MTLEDRAVRLLRGASVDRTPLFPFILGFCARNAGHPVATIIKTPKKESSSSRAGRTSSTALIGARSMGTPLTARGSSGAQSRCPKAASRRPLTRGSRCSPKEMSLAFPCRRRKQRAVCRSPWNSPGSRPLTGNPSPSCAPATSPWRATSRSARCAAGCSRSRIRPSPHALCHRSYHRRGQAVVRSIRAGTGDPPILGAPDRKHDHLA